MKNLILENWCMQDIPDELQEILEDRFLENREYWVQFQSAFYPENREETIKRFKSLEEGDNIVCQTVFVDWQQLELMALVLNQCTVRLNVYIFIYDLKGKIKKYLEDYESDITPNTKEYDDSPELREEFKEKMNRLVKTALKFHNIYNLNTYSEFTERVEIE